MRRAIYKMFHILQSCYCIVHHFEVAIKIYEFLSYS